MTQQSHTAFKKKSDSAICNNMDGPGGHCAKWNKPDTERKEKCMISMCYI